MRRIKILLSVDLEFNDECLGFDPELTCYELHAVAAAHLTVDVQDFLEGGKVLKAEVISTVLSSGEVIGK